RWSIGDESGFDVKTARSRGSRGVMQVALVLVCGLGGACVKFYLVLKGARREAEADREDPRI
ncbi:hypothetical protein LTI14_07150, partial [Nesterenkonia sp. YGD6]|uniref:hypothetical protein n=1 Tax=Nesterenkonia sp. YGD6 TaxID=2901231 RepID=UPI001F4C7FDC